MKKSLQVKATCNGVTTNFDYKEIALFALLIGNRLSYTRAAEYKEEAEWLDEVNKHINDFLDKIDKKNNNKHQNHE